MKILGLDTSSKAASCAITDGDTLVGEFFVNADLTHSQTALPMVQALLDCTHTKIADIDLFAVSTGPGSFTGLRIGIAAIKGLAMATGKPCVGVSTLEGLAANLLAFPGYIAPAMDARCAQVYTALFHSDGQALTRVVDDDAITIQDLHGRLAALAPAPVLLVGDGAQLCMRELSQLAHVRLCPESLRHQRAASICTRAPVYPPTDPATLAPAYLRLPQAERELRKRQQSEG